MKNILVPTDYSPNARNAAEYAIHLAKATGASVEFLHVFSPPETVEELSADTSLDELTKLEKTKLNKEAKYYGSTFGIKINTIVYPGELHKVLAKMMVKQSADLVVVGMRGLSVVDKIFFGNTTTNLVKHASYPLLIIPAQFKFMPLKHITIGADYNSLLGVASFSLLKDLVGPFKGTTQVVHIDQTEEDLTEVVDRTESEKYFQRAFEGIRHSYTTLEADNVVLGLVDFLKTKNSDMIVMIPQKHNAWQSLFLGSSTKKMAYQTEIPLLLLPGSGA